MIDPFWLLVGGAGVVVAASSKEEEESPPEVKRKRFLYEVRGVQTQEAGLKVFAETSPRLPPYEVEGTWWPDYVKWVGCNWFRYGVCWADLAADLAEYDGQKWAGTANDIITSVANIYSIGDYGAGDIAEWLSGLFCYRWRWELGEFKINMNINDPEGGQQISLWEVDRVEGDLFPPEHPLPPVSGWTRVWVNESRNEYNRLPGRTRSPFTYFVYWPTEKITTELLGQPQIRSLLRMQAEGALSMDNLDDAACGRDKGFIARRSKAMAEYK